MRLQRMLQMTMPQQNHQLPLVQFQIHPCQRDHLDLPRIYLGDPTGDEQGLIGWRGSRFVWHAPMSARNPRRSNPK